MNEFSLPTGFIGQLTMTSDAARVIATTFGVKLLERALEDAGLARAQHTIRLLAVACHLDVEKPGAIDDLIRVCCEEGVAPQPTVAEAGVILPENFEYKPFKHMQSAGAPGTTLCGDLQALSRGVWVTLDASLVTCPECMAVIRKHQKETVPPPMVYAQFPPDAAERRRYALLQAAATIHAVQYTPSNPIGTLTEHRWTIGESVGKAIDLLAEIESRESADVKS